VFAQTHTTRALISPQVWIIEHKLTLAAHEGAKPPKTRDKSIIVATVARRKRQSITPSDS
jgi:hypothetical protein